MLSMERKSSNDATIAMIGLLFSSPLVAMRYTIWRTPQTLKQHNRATLRMDSVALFLCIVRYFVGEEILLERTSFVYSFIVVIKQKTRPGSLFHGKRGGFCCCKYREYILNHKTFFKKTLRIFLLQFKTTRCLQQKDTLFAIKRYVIFIKTSRRFQ